MRIEIQTHGIRLIGIAYNVIVGYGGRSSNTSRHNAPGIIQLALVSFYLIIISRTGRRAHRSISFMSQFNRLSL